MAASVEGKTLEACLNQATNPALTEEDPEAIAEFCDQVNRELEGPHYAVRLLAHKIQSPMEREAIYALATLEACVKNCGKRFHQEIGKFRFLNEIIKVISPKYLGTKTTEKVKKKCIELMYCLHKGLPHEPKISDAYKMLKQQGIVKEDPVYMDKLTDDIPKLKPVTEEEKRAVFEDEEKSKLLARLLKSKNPEDLQAANRLIKNMVKQDSERMEKVSRRINELETIEANVKLLTEMVKHYNPHSTTQSELEMMKELYESLEKLRPKLFRLASDTEEKDTEGLNTILKANDAVSNIMNQYKKTVEGVQENGQMSDDKGSSSLLDLAFDQPSTPSSQTGPSQGLSLLDDEMLSLGLQSPPATSSQKTMNNTSDPDNLLSDLDDIFSSAAVGTQQTFPTATAAAPPVIPAVPTGGFSVTMGMAAPAIAPTQQITGILPNSQANALGSADSALTVTPVVNSTSPAAGTQKSALEDLDLLGQKLMQENLTENTAKYSFNPTPAPAPKLTLNQMASSQSSSMPLPTLPVVPPAVTSHPPPVSTVTGSLTTTVCQSVPVSTEVKPLTDVFVPLESIQPGDAPPVNAYDKNGLKVLIHVAKGRPRDDVLVMVVSVISTNSAPVKAFVFQAAVPKIMKVKLQPPSATELPAFNPILPPSAITQVMLLANPSKEKIRLKFKLSYTLNDTPCTDMGDIDSFGVV